MKVLIAAPLRPYTGQAWVQASGATLGAVLDDLDRRYPGIRFRIVDEQQRTRPNMRFFVGGRAVFDLATPLHDADELCLVQALSGG
jgi:molybdopterin converting factor small subunit